MSLIGKLKRYALIPGAVLKTLTHKPIKNANVEVLILRVPGRKLAIDDILDTFGGQQRLFYPDFLEMKVDDWSQAVNYIVENHADKVKYVAVKTEEDPKWNHAYRNDAFNWARYPEMIRPILK